MIRRKINMQLSLDPVSFQREDWYFPEDTIEVAIRDGYIITAHLKGTHLFWNWVVGQFDTTPRRIV